MSTASETRENIIDWLHTQLSSEAARVGIEAMTTAALRQYKAELEAETAEMDRDGRLQTLWKHEGFPI